MSGRRVAGAIRVLVNARDLQLEFARLLHETLLVPVLFYDSETTLWKEKERSGVTHLPPKQFSISIHILIYLPSNLFIYFLFALNYTPFNLSILFSVSFHSSFFCLLIAICQHLIPSRFLSSNHSF